MIGLTTDQIGTWVTPDQREFLDTAVQQHLLERVPTGRGVTHVAFVPQGWRSSRFGRLETVVQQGGAVRRQVNVNEQVLPRNRAEVRPYEGSPIEFKPAWSEEPNPLSAVPQGRAVDQPQVPTRADTCASEADITPKPYAESSLKSPAIEGGMSNCCDYATIEDIRRYQAGLNGLGQAATPQAGTEPAGMTTPQPEGTSIVGKVLDSLGITDPKTWQAAASYGLGVLGVYLQNRMVQQVAQQAGQQVQTAQQVGIPQAELDRVLAQTKYQLDLARQAIAPEPSIPTWVWIVGGVAAGLLIYKMVSR